MSPAYVFRSRIRLTLIATVALGALGISACAGSESARSTPTPAFAARTATVTPSPIPKATVAPETVYTVAAGDTAWAIAADFGITLGQLATANDLTEADLEQLQIGQKLRIPAPKP